MSGINDFNAGETKGCYEHLDARTVLRLKQNRIDHLYAHPGHSLGAFCPSGSRTRRKGNSYSMMSPFEMAQASLVDRGISISGFGNRTQIVNLAFARSTGDYFHIVAGGAEKSVLTGWQNSGETFQQWTKQVLYITSTKPCG